MKPSWVPLLAAPSTIARAEFGASSIAPAAAVSPAPVPPAARRSAWIEIVPLPATVSPPALAMVRPLAWLSTSRMFDPACVVATASVTCIATELVSSRSPVVAVKLPRLTIWLPLPWVVRSTLPTPNGPASVLTTSAPDWVTLPPAAVTSSNLVTLPVKSVAAIDTLPPCNCKVGVLSV